MTKKERLIAMVAIFVLVLFYFRAKKENKVDPTSEKYCRQYKIENCPKTCEVRPSCPECADIGCHEITT